MAEAIGPSNNTQVFNYGVTDLSSSTPIYGIYEVRLKPLPVQLDDTERKT
jgi:hypothetical protein